MASVAANTGIRSAVVLVGGWGMALWLGSRWRTWYSLARFRSLDAVDRSRSWDHALLAALLVLALLAVTIPGTDFVAVTARLAAPWSIVYTGSKWGCHVLGCCGARRASGRTHLRIPLPLLEAALSVLLAATCGAAMALGAKDPLVASAFLLGHALIRFASVRARRVPGVPLAPGWGTRAAVLVAIVIGSH